MNEATREYTLADFQQQVAEKYGYENYNKLISAHEAIGIRPTADYLRNEAIELYATYRYEDGIERGIIEAFEQGKQAGEAKWIKTEERKPEFDRDVLVSCRIYGRFIARFEEIDKSGWGNWRHGTELGILPPTHWMPLPEHPKNLLKQEED